jgi:hypothetical protein
MTWTLVWPNPKIIEICQGKRPFVNRHTYIHQQVFWTINLELPKNWTKLICWIDLEVQTSSMEDFKFTPSLWDPLHFKIVITILLTTTTTSTIVSLWKSFTNMTNHHLNQEITTFYELPWLPTNFSGSIAHNKRCKICTYSIHIQILYECICDFSPMSIDFVFLMYVM